MSLADNLRHLFHIEGQVRGLRSRLDSARRYLNHQDRLLRELHQHSSELETRQKQIKAGIGNLEVEIAALDQRLEKLRDELNSATTNKQYTAVLTELNTAKLSRSELEDQALQEMERVDENKAELERLVAEAAEREKVRSVAESELRQRHDEIGERLAELEAEREEAAAAIPAEELRIFNELADAYEGEAMAVIEEIDRRHREYACGACNMQLPFETIASLLGSVDLLVPCVACGRILYLKEETRGALAKK